MSKVRHIQLEITPANFEVENGKWYLKGFTLKKHLSFEDAEEIINKIFHLNFEIITSFYCRGILNPKYTEDDLIIAANDAKYDLISDLEGLITGESFSSIEDYLHHVKYFYNTQPFTYIGVDLMLYLKDRGYI